VTGGSNESDENDIKNPMQASLPDASTTIKREMPLRNDRDKPAHNWNKLCAVVLNNAIEQLMDANRLGQHVVCTPTPRI
jgi:hypothetical protein